MATETMLPFSEPPTHGLSAMGTTKSALNLAKPCECKRAFKRHNDLVVADATSAIGGEYVYSV